MKAYYVYKCIILTTSHCWQAAVKQVMHSANSLIGTVRSASRQLHVHFACTIYTIIHLLV